MPNVVKKHGQQIAGALATVGYGTALGIVRAAIERGKDIKVVATESRPVLQGARLTVFELINDGIDVTLIPDTAVGFCMKKQQINKVIVGADRILKSGHVFNKIGTYQIALSSKSNRVPFYVAAPSSTFDLSHLSWKEITVEERDPAEVRMIGGKQITLPKVKVLNPSFDVTPPNLVTAIITDVGVIRKPYSANIPKRIIQ